MPTENSQLASFNRPRLWSTLDYLVLAFMALSPVVDRSFNLLGFLVILVSIVIVVKQRDELPAARRETRWLYYVLIANFLLASIYIVIGRDSMDIVKDPLRLLGMIPIMLAVSIIGLRPGRLFLGLAAGMIGASMVVGYQIYVTETFRGVAAYNPNPFSEFAMSSGTVLLCSIFLLGGWMKTVTILGAVAAFYCVLISASRGTLLAFVPMGLVCLAVVIRFRAFRKIPWEALRRKSTLGVGALILLVVTGMGVKIGSTVIARFDAAIDQFSEYRRDRSIYSSVSVRMELWYATWLAFKEAPLTGIGSDNDNRRAYLRDLESKGIVYLGNKRFKHNHSDYFDSLMRQGLPGVLIVIGLYWVLFVHYWRSLASSTREQFALALAGLLTVTGYAAFSVTEVPLRNSLTLVFFAVINAVLMGMLQHSGAARVASVRPAASTDPEPR